MGAKKAGADGGGGGSRSGAAFGAAAGHGAGGAEAPAVRTRVTVLSALFPSPPRVVYPPRDSCALRTRGVASALLTFLGSFPLLLSAQAVLSRDGQQRVMRDIEAQFQQGVRRERDAAHSAGRGAAACPPVVHNGAGFCSSLAVAADAICRFRWSSTDSFMFLCRLGRQRTFGTRGLGL